jgi:hypothetical protein
MVSKGVGVGTGAACANSFFFFFWNLLFFPTSPFLSLAALRATKKKKKKIEKDTKKSSRFSPLDSAPQCLFLIIAIVFIGMANAQLPDILKGKVTPITGPPSTTCSNKFINNTSDAFTIDDILCDTRLVPEQFQQYVPGLKLGPTSAACAGYACALRFLGCANATYRTEVKIVTATGQAEMCGERTGHNASTCQAIGAFITSVPVVGRKRGVIEDETIEPFTQAELDVEVAAAKRTPKDELSEADLHFVKLLVRAYLPAESGVLGLARDDTLDNYMARKRETANEILKRAQLCSSTISAGVDLLVAQVPHLAIIKGKFGPCGEFCEMAMCGLTLMCHSASRSALLSLEAQRVILGCNKTSCSTWAPPSKVCPSTPSCDNRVGQFAPNTLTLATCPPPKQIRSAGQLAANDCCDRCEDKCATVACRTLSVEDCGVPAWPLCKPFVVDREDPYQCCATCIDVCATSSCPLPPRSCPSGTFLGPTNSSTCCLACVEPCAGVACPNAPTREECEGQGKEWQLKDRKTLDGNKSQCVDCCPQCVAKGSTKPSVTETAGTPPTTALAPPDACAMIKSEIEAQCANSSKIVSESYTELLIAAKLGVKSEVTQKKCASLRDTRVCYASVLARHATCTMPWSSRVTADNNDFRSTLPACKPEIAELLAQIDCDICDAVPIVAATGAAERSSLFFRFALAAAVWLVCK